MESISKAKIKWIRSLGQKKNREAEGVFVAEGEKTVLEGLEIPQLKLVCLVVQKDAVHLVSGYQDLPAFTASASEMEQLSAFKTPNKLIAVFKRPEQLAATSGFTLALDDVQDPGNMGTIMRLADWFGIKTVVCSQQTVDCYNPKVIQASMGAIFRVQVVYTDLGTFLKESGKPVYGALLNGTNYSSVQYDKSGILLMGNEGNGISEALLPLVTEAVTIPRIGGAESLNVATATAILLAEVHR